MKRNELYRQCRLVKKVREGEAFQMSYIPAEFASVGRVVKLREEDGAWDDGWVIRLVGESMTEEQLNAIELAHRRFERATSRHSPPRAAPTADM